MEKITLSIKTKIAAWWMIGIGGTSLLIYSAPLLLGAWGNLLPLLFAMPGILFFVISGWLLLKRKRLGWWFSIVILLINLIIGHPVGSSGPPFVYDPMGGGLIALVSIFSPLLLHFMAFFERFPQIWSFNWILIFIFLIPLFLLFLDRKKFWKIAS